MAIFEWLKRPSRRPAEPLTFAEALVELGFDAEAYLRAYPSLGALSAVDAARHYDVSGRHERLAIDFRRPFAEGAARIGGLPIPDEARDQLRLDLAAAILRTADPYGQDAARTADLLLASPAYEPLLVIADSHGSLYLTDDVLRAGRLLPAPLLCTGASARGLTNARSLGGAAERIRAHLAEHHDRIAGVLVLLKFGQVDLEFVHDYRRIRDGRRDFSLREAVAFAQESARRYVAFARALQDETPARLVVTAALPPALNDAALREGYLNAHIAELHGGLDAEALRQALRELEMPDWRTRTDLARAYNAAVAEGCAQAGLPFLDDFTPLCGPEGLVASEAIAWHGGTDHHLCFTHPFVRHVAGELATRLAALRQMCSTLP